MKRHTRKKLLQRLDDIQMLSKGIPVKQFNIEFITSDGCYLLEKDENLYSLDELLARLMDLSLTHRMARIHMVEFVFTKGMCVTFVLREDKNNLTNIDVEFMDKIMKLNFVDHLARR